MQWRKSSYSSDNGECVEVAEVPDAIHVRDSKNPEGAQLRFSCGEWMAFVQGVTS